LSAYRVRLTNRAAKQLEELPDDVRSRVIAALGAVAEDPHQGVKLLGPLAGSRRYRVGDYRIVYQLDETDRVVVAENIRYRGHVYRR